MQISNWFNHKKRELDNPSKGFPRLDHLLDIFEANVLAIGVDFGRYGWDVAANVEDGDDRQE